MGVRVEDVDGRVLAAEWQIPTFRQGFGEESPEPERRSDGLVVRRPDSPHDPYRYDDPMFQSYHWVAMLHPFELADGVELDEDGALAGPSWFPDLSPIEALTGPKEVDHHGRAALEVEVATTDHYASRCPCCPLLDGAQASRRLSAAGWPQELNGEPEVLRLRLDTQTGVLVQLIELGGRTAVGNWFAIIEAVDHDVPRELFGPRPHVQS